MGLIVRARSLAQPSVLLGVMIWALGLGPGFERGLDEGVQSQETGQVQFVSRGTGWDQYFYLKALVQGIPGVEAVSARLEQPFQVSNEDGRVKVARVRVINFVEEDKVTRFLSRVNNGVNGPLSGLVVPGKWLEEGYAYPSGHATLTPLGAPGSPTQVPVTGTMGGTRGAEEDEAYLDMGTARTILGPDLKMTALVIRLGAGIDPAAWVRDHGSSFRNIDGELKTWDVLSQPFRSTVHAAALPLFVFRDLVVAMTFLGTVGWGWSRRWELPLLGTGVPKPWMVLASALGFLGMVAVSGALLWAVFPLWEDLLIGNLQGVSPPGSPSPLPWMANWETWAVPAGTLALAFGLAVFKARRRSDSQPQ